MTEPSSINHLPSWFEDITKSLKGRPKSWRPGATDSSSEEGKFSDRGRRIKSSVSESFILLDDTPDSLSLASPRYGRRATPRGESSTESLSSSNDPILSVLEAQFGELTVEENCSRRSRSNSGTRSLLYSTWTSTSLDQHTYLPNFKRRESILDSSLIDDQSDQGENTNRVRYDNLEESWTSLNLFNKIQKGRLFEIQDGPNWQELLEKELSEFNEEKQILPEPIEVLDEHFVEEEQESFIIPELPSGQVLILDILSTWGDRHYLGLNGIEIFTVTGDLVPISKIEADPSNINVLPEYGKDPRIVSNLLDRVNRTRDDMHLWLTPFTPGNHHTITITFSSPQTIALIRIWNYNKSRIHSCRGAKDVVICLDDIKIFQGEIARASGGILGSTDTFGDTILFTTDEEILDLVSKNDDSFESVMNEGFDSSISSSIHLERPLTADPASPEVRPFTSHIGVTDGYYGGSVLCEKNITLVLTKVWDFNSHVIGLTGIQIISDKGLVVSPSDIASRHNKKHLSRLLNNKNDTSDDNEMWETHFDNKPIKIKFYFQTPIHISALYLWNYNKVTDLPYCGVKMLSIYVDDKIIVEDICIRRAPGHCHYPIAQRIPFVKSINSNINDINGLKSGLSLSGLDVGDEYELAEMPCGFIYQFTLLTTWGDVYYVGLNGIELFDSQAQPISIDKSVISAYPSSINILDGVENDVRTPEKLIDGINNTRDGKHAWLAPILPNQVNRIYIVFDSPTYVSMVKIWNYGKTPARGVKEFGILVDDLLVYNGILESADKVSIPYKTIIFSGDFNKNESLNYDLGNEDVGSMKTSRLGVLSADQSLRPFTSLRAGSSF